MLICLFFYKSIIFDHNIKNGKLISSLHMIHNLYCNIIYSSIFYFYSCANNNWNWKFDICCFSHPTLSSALILELVVRLAHICGLGEKNICCLFTHSCMLQLLQLLLFTTTIYLSKMTDLSKKHAH